MSNTETTKAPEDKKLVTQKDLNKAMFRWYLSAENPESGTGGNRRGRTEGMPADSALQASGKEFHGGRNRGEVPGSCGKKSYRFHCRENGLFRGAGGKSLRPDPDIKSQTGKRLL